MNHYLLLEWNTNYLLYMFYLILFNLLTIFIVTVIRLIFSYNERIFGNNSSKKKIKIFLKMTIAILIGILNSVNIFFYMFSSLKINFIIIAFIPILLIICLNWSIRISIISSIPSIIVYCLIGCLYLKVSLLDVLTPIFALLIMFTGTVFCKIYNIKKYWKLFLIQSLFSFICAIIMSITLNSSDNIYVIFNNEQVKLNTINISDNFLFYFINIILVNLSSNFINLLIFISVYILTDRFEQFIQNLLAINNLSYYEDGIFLNNTNGVKRIKKEIENDEFYLSINIFLPTLNSIIKDINYKDQKIIKSRIIKQLEIKMKKYNPIYYKNKLGFYSLFINLKEFNINSNLNDIYNFKNEKFNELCNALTNHVNVINYNNKKYLYVIKNFLILYGIQTYDFKELELISYKLYRENRNSKKSLFIYNPNIDNLYLNNRINFNKIPEIDKTKINITLLENKTLKSIIEPNISYVPYLLLTKNDLYEYLSNINQGVKIERYLALEVLKKYKNNELNKLDKSIVIDYPEQTLIDDELNLIHLLDKINELNISKDKIIFRFNHPDLYKHSNFIRNIDVLKEHNIKIWLAKISSDEIIKLLSYIKADYISFNPNIIGKKIEYFKKIYFSISRQNNFLILDEYI